MGLAHAHALVKGKVQGIGFRAWTMRKATTLGLFGWVKNLSDGDVEVVLEGEEAVVKKMIDALHIGPEFAQVEKVEVAYGEYAGSFSGFGVKG